VVRPGRCLAQLEIGRLPRPEATAWLERSGATGVIGPEGATLAELTALTSDGRQVIAGPPLPPPPATGFYL
jgi:hypothetical protein